MKIYFDCTGQFYKEQPQLYTKIIKILEKLATKKPYVALAEIDYEKDTEEEILNSVKKMEKELKNADVIITENTYSKAGIGFDIAYALNNHKPVLVLDLIDPKDKGPHPINRLPNKYLSYKVYNQENIEKVIKKFLEEAKSKMDSKFIFIISPEIDRYLKWVSDYRRIHKAQAVRSAVEKKLKSDSEYKSEKK